MTEGQDIREFNKQVITKFRESGGVGELGPIHFDQLVLLTTTGRKSGELRTVPIGAARDDADNLLLFASNMGSPKDPDWYLNLAADRHVTIEITGASWETDAEILDGEARDDAYNRWIEMAPHVAGHQEKAGRRIPMVRVATS